MPGKDTSQKDSGRQVDRPQPKSGKVEGQPQGLPLTSQLADLPDESNAQGARQATALLLQRQLGNNFVQRQIATNQVAMQEEEEAATVPLADPKALAFERELEGHPFGPLVQREDEAAGEGETTPAAEITLVLKDPDINRMSEKRIQDKHGKEGIAGYTKPTIGFAVPEIEQYKIKVTVTITFAMDLASEFSGGRLQVLRDHENAHILIAEKVANEYAIGPLKDELEALPDFSRANQPQIQTKFNEKYQDFKDNEGTESEAFDGVDYPRMKQAYYGVKTSLADLASGSAEIKKVVDAVDGFNSRGKGAAGDAETMSGLVQPLVEAQSTLSDDDLARLQYNAEFKTKVSSAQKIVQELIEKGDSLDADVKAKLDELAPVLEKFTWTPEIS